MTNTKVKFILVTTDLDVRDADVRNVSVTIWKSFVKTVYTMSEMGEALYVSLCCQPFVNYSLAEIQTLVNI